MQTKITLAEFENKAQDKIFNVKFIKNNGVIRKFNVRLNALGINAKYKPETGREYIRCVTMPKGEVKCFDIERVLELSLRGCKYGITPSFS